MVRQPMLRFRVARKAAPRAASAATLRAVFKQVRLVQRHAAPVRLDTVTPPAPAYPSLFGFRTVGEVKGLPVSVPAPFVVVRPPLDQTARARRLAERRPPSRPTKFALGPTPYGASSVGITASGGTTITMVPANLLATGTTYITDFVAVSLDAGVY